MVENTPPKRVKSALQPFVKKLQVRMLRVAFIDYYNNTYYDNWNGISRKFPPLKTSGDQQCIDEMFNDDTIKFYVQFNCAEFLSKLKFLIASRCTLYGEIFIKYYSSKKDNGENTFRRGKSALQWFKKKYRCASSAFAFKDYYSNTYYWLKYGISREFPPQNLKGPTFTWWNV